MTPDAFLTRWRSAIEERARLVFAEMVRPEVAGTHCDIGDAVVRAKGLTPIGFNWELLDLLGGVDEPRSALGVLARALENDMEYPQQSWLGGELAATCAEDFAAMLGAGATLLSNRIEDYWNPVTDARIEWAFVGYDDARAVMMVLMRD